jgi:hypothetical protein
MGFGLSSNAFASPTVSMTFVHAGLVPSSLLKAEQRYYLYLEITIGSILRPQDRTILVPLQEPSVARPPVWVECTHRSCEQETASSGQSARTRSASASSVVRFAIRVGQAYRLYDLEERDDRNSFSEVSSF